MINTFDINQEIFINNQIKIETEILNSLLILKQNSMMNPMINPTFQNINNNNNFIPLLNPNNMNNNLLQMQQQQLIQENEPKNNNNNENNFKGISLVFSSDNGYISVNCGLEDKFSEVIQRYKIKANSQDISEKFIFNARVISPDITVKKIGLKNGDLIIVY